MMVLALPLLHFDYCSYSFIALDASANELPSLLVRKFKQCCTMFDFDDPLSEVRSKEVKRLCLVELVEFISKPGIMNSEELYTEFMRMVGRVSAWIYTRFCHVLLT